MAETVTGNLAGLPPSELTALERIFRRRVAPTEVVSVELAEFMAERSASMHRQVGVFIDRRGAITHVMVGDASKIMLPDVGRLRGAAGRFRGLRLVHTHLRGERLTRDDLTDLALLRLDLVAAITVDATGRPQQVYVGHIDPSGPADRPWHELPGEPVHAMRLDAAALIAGLEASLGRPSKASATDTAALGGRDKALLVHVAVGKQHDSEARIAELRELCRTAGVPVVDVLTQRRQALDPRTLVGRGKLDEILLRAMQLGADAVIFDPDLTPGQARAISDATDLKVLDRTMLILDIFAQHATSRDGKLQVELAQLRYALPRLIEKNTMMSRLTAGPGGKAGLGGRGPGETKLEINRRRARDRIHGLEKQLDELAQHRRLRRSRRGQRAVPIVAICGYTNAGKSTLLNALTRGDAIAADKLFATLDPISRRLRFPHEREVVITDTVGFIRDLPKDLTRAFRATLEEMGDADLLLHVVDAADPDRDQHIRAVDAVLTELELADRPRLLVWNKCDRLGPAEVEHLTAHGGGYPVSAMDRATFGPMLLAIERAMWNEGAGPHILARGGASLAGC
ncbi:MAG: GTPase HflX [Kofleriaceae bacterium]|jgi:GTP-binding protein HflX|nr:GTPase HflX [Kofleriaceae bacterium]MBP6835850.1 GTPase HflX [Kofleriaceae bacterium]MBP9202569.1 GTPase HflX [Kofleriaceae bacterium]